MNNYEFWTIYLAVALSAAFFATRVIFVPAMEELRKRAVNSSFVKNRVRLLLDNYLMSGVVFFAMVGIMAPFFITPLLFEGTRQIFVKGFVDGVID